MICINSLLVFYCGPLSYCLNFLIFYNTNLSCCFCFRILCLAALVFIVVLLLVFVYLLFENLFYFVFFLIFLLQFFVVLRSVLSYPFHVGFIFPFLKLINSFKFSKIFLVSTGIHFFQIVVSWRIKQQVFFSNFT